MSSPLHHSWTHCHCRPFSRVPETSNKDPRWPPIYWFSGNLSPYLLDLSKVSDLSSSLPSQAHPSLRFHDTTFSYLSPPFLVSPWIVFLTPQGCQSLQYWVNGSHSSTLHRLSLYTSFGESSPHLWIPPPSSCWHFPDPWLQLWIHSRAPLDPTGTFHLKL